MEILQGLGVAEELYATATIPNGVSFYTNLSGYRLGTLQIGDNPEYVESVMGATATPGCVSSQIELECILKQHADDNDLVTVLFSHEKLELEQDADGVRVRVLDRDRNEEIVVEASYVLACDGVHSSTRKESGRTLVGPAAFGHIMNVYIEADIESLVDENNQALYWIATPGAPGVFIGLGGDGKKWCFNTPYFPAQGERPEDFTEARCLEVVHKALGTDRLPVRILAKSPWVLCGQVVDEFRDGRVFFGGDAAHLNIPTGGFGFNTGMQETHNLAWKLAGVLAGWAPPALLETYHQERRPIAMFNVEKSRENAVRIRETGEQRDHFLFLGQEIGFGYWNSPLVLKDGTPHYAEAHGIDNPILNYVPNARPGARAPHCWVAHADDPETPRAILSLFGDRFVLLMHGGGDRWAETLTDDVREIPFAAYSVGPPGSDRDLVDINEQWAEFYGVPAAGAVLVRPDGHVCWRTCEAPTSQDDPRLAHALMTATGRSSSSISARTRQESSK
jgi:2-polyprenyl-6-methoxyphenol hydroxylase-like FAD-dependent oxidoreductase